MSTGPLTSLTVAATNLMPNDAWPTVNDLVLAAAAASSAPAVLVSAASRKVHGSAGTFDLPLTLTPSANPTTEPRQVAAATVVMTFDKVSYRRDGNRDRRDGHADVDDLRWQ